MQAIRAMQPCKPCKPCIHAKNDLHRPREHKVMPNGPSVPKWA